MLKLIASSAPDILVLSRRDSPVALSDRVSVRTVHLYGDFGRIVKILKPGSIVSFLKLTLNLESDQSRLAESQY